MPIPSGVETVTVTSGEPLTTPDGSFMRGHIRFVAPPLAVAPSDNYTLGGEAVAELVDGMFTITLVAPDATGLNPTGWTYSAIGEFTNAPDWSTFIDITKANPSVFFSDVVETVGTDPSFSSIFVRTAGDTMTGPLVLSGDPVVALGAATKQYVDAGDATAVHLTGNQTVAGIKTFTSIPLGPAVDPSDSNHLTRKQYVDAQAALKLAIANNLSDLANPVTARTNLGLGTAATRNVGVLNTNVADGEAVGLTSGIISGGEINVNGSNPLAVDIGSTVGFVVDYTTTPSSPVVTRVSTGPQTVVLANLVNPITWWMMTSTGTIVQQITRPTNSQRRTHLQLGATVQAGGVAIIVDQSLPVILNQPVNQLYDLMYALGSFSIFGNEITSNGANLTFAKTAGDVFAPSFNRFAGPVLTNDPHVSPTTAQAPAQFRYIFQNTNPVPPPITTIDPANYDVGGVLTPVPGGANTSTIQRVYLFAANNTPDQLVIQRGQNTYANLDAAVAAISTEPFVVNPTARDNGVLIGFIVLTKSATQLNNSTHARFIQAAKFGTGSAGAGVADVSGFMLKSANLSDVASVATSRTNLGLGNSATLNVGTVANTVAAGNDVRFADSSVFNVMSFGATGNGKVVNDGAMTASSAVLTCATSAPFVVGDVGKPIQILNAGASNETLVGTIASFISATQVNISVPAGATVSDMPVMYSTDDTAAFQAAINAAVAYGLLHSYSATVLIPAADGAFYGIAGALQTGGSTFGNSQITLPVLPTTGRKFTLTIRGRSGSAAGVQHWQQTFPNTTGASLVSFGLFANATVQANNINANGNAAVIGGPSQPGGFGVAPGVFSNMYVNIQDLSVLTCHSKFGFTYTGIDLSGVANAQLRDGMVSTTGTVAPPGASYQNPSVFATGLAIGVLFPANGNNDLSMLHNWTIGGGYTYGLLATEHLDIYGLRILYCWAGLCPVGSYFSSVGAAHSINGSLISIEACTYILYIFGPGTGGLGPTMYLKIDTETSTPRFGDRTSGTSLAAARGEIVLAGLFTASGLNLDAPTGLKIKNGQLSFPITTKTANYTATSFDEVILADATAGAVTISLPTAVGRTDRITVKKVDSSINPVNLDGFGTETIDGQLTKGIAYQWDYITLAPSGGASWRVVSAPTFEPFRKRDLPDQVLSDSLYAGTAPVIGTAQTGTPTAGYIKQAPAGVALAGSDVTGAFTYAGADNFQIGVGSPDNTYVLPLSRYPNTYASGQSSYSVEFNTDAQIVQLRFKYISAATMYRLTIDGRRVTDLPQSSGGITPGSTHLLTVDLGTAAPRKWRFDFTTMPFGGVFIPPTASLWSTALDGGVWMVLGDSLSDGSAQNTGSALGTWVDRVGRLMGSTDVWRQSRGGTGYITAGSFANRLAGDVFPWQPTRLIIWGGFNDSGGSQPAIQAAADSLYASIKATLPACEVFVIGCWSNVAAPGASIINTDNTLKTAAATAGFPFISPVTGSVYDKNGVLVQTHGAWINAANVATYVGGDAIHPTDAGHIYLTRRIYSSIKDLMPV